MTNSQNTKRALFSSVMALLLCFTMLLGTTFAWFTDNAVSGRNIIKSGNLDVVLQYKTSWGDEWAPVEPDTKLFKENALYEPGYTEVVFLRVSNAGNLALKYNLNVNVAEETKSTNVYGEEFSLMNYLEIGYYVQDEFNSGANYADILMPLMFGTREAALNNVETLTKLENDNGVIRSNAPVLAGTETAQVVAIVLTMPDTVGNEANHMIDIPAPTIDLGVTLVATQLTEEEDSFDDQYDEGAEYPVIVNTNAELKDALQGGNDIVLSTNFTLTDETIKITDDVVIDLNGNDLDATASTSRPFELDNGADLVITGSSASEIQLGSFGLVNIVAGSESNVTLNGGNYVGAMNKGSFIKPRGDKAINITLNDVTLTDTSADSYLIDASSYEGDELTITVNGGEYNVSSGIVTGYELTMKDVTLTVANLGVEANNALIENCTITVTGNNANPAAPSACVAVNSNGTVTVKNSTLKHEGGEATAIYTSGGTIALEGCTVIGTHAHYVTGKYDNAEFKTTVDGTEVTDVVLH